MIKEIVGEKIPAIFATLVFPVDLFNQYNVSLMVTMTDLMRPWW